MHTLLEHATGARRSDRDGRASARNRRTLSGVRRSRSAAVGRRRRRSRPARLEAERDELTAAINRLLALTEAGAGDAAELAAKLKTRTAEREALNRRITLLPAPTSRAELRAVLEKRVANWKARLLSEFRDETRFVLDQLLQSRSIVLLGVTAADFEDAQVVGFFDDDDRGKEGIEPEDCVGFDVY
jgi:hypothetical protein